MLSGGKFCILNTRPCLSRNFAFLITIYLFTFINFLLLSVTLQRAQRTNRFNIIIPILRSFSIYGNHAIVHCFCFRFKFRFSLMAREFITLLYQALSGTQKNVLRIEVKRNLLSNFLFVRKTVRRFYFENDFDKADLNVTLHERGTCLDGRKTFP